MVIGGKKIMWVARDAWGYLKGFMELPSRFVEDGEWYSPEDDFNLPKILFPNLKWEDEPLEVELVEVKDND